MQRDRRLILGYLFLRPIHLRVSPKYGQFYSRENLRWAFAILFSRVVRLTNLDGTLALIPWADMLNHSPTGARPPLHPCDQAPAEGNGRA